MCFNDDFDFDDYDGMEDMDDDFTEDLFDEEFEPEPDDMDMDAKPDDPVSPESPFDFQDAFILGGMIVGQAYEEMLDEKEQQNQEDNEGEDFL
jgi:hypothetical protein